MKYRTVKATVVKKTGARRYGVMRVRVGKPLKYDSMTASFAQSISRAAAHKRNNNLPVAKYDEKADRAYLEYPDGQKEYLDEA